MTLEPASEEMSRHVEQHLQMLLLTETINRPVRTWEDVLKRKQAISELERMRIHGDPELRGPWIEQSRGL